MKLKPSLPPEPITHPLHRHRNKWFKSKALVASIIGITAAIFFGYYWFTPDTVVRIECKAIEGGQDCLLTQSQATPRHLYVCWEIVRICASGQSSVAKKCDNALIEPGTPTHSLIAASDFSNLAQCASVSAQSIEHMTVVPSWLAPASEETP